MAGGAPVRHRRRSPSPAWRLAQGQPGHIIHRRQPRSAALHSESVNTGSPGPQAVGPMVQVHDGPSRAGPMVLIPDGRTVQ